MRQRHQLQQEIRGRAVEGSAVGPSALTNSPGYLQFRRGVQFGQVWLKDVPSGIDPVVFWFVRTPFSPLQLSFNSFLAPPINR